eukprot:6502472-Pyramimonas_sp.AAC.1
MGKRLMRPSSTVALAIPSAPKNATIMSILPGPGHVPPDLAPDSQDGAYQGNWRHSRAIGFAHEDHQRGPARGEVRIRLPPHQHVYQTLYEVVVQEIEGPWANAIHS